eukprot:RCo020047
MATVWMFVLFSAKQRLTKPTHWQRFGPLYCVSLAVPLVVADLLRHVLQDKSLTALDLLSFCLFAAALMCGVLAHMCFTHRPWGPFSVPRGAVFRLSCFQHTPMLLVMSGVLLTVLSHTSSSATRLWWPGCGNNPVFPRVNQTWSPACRWSSTQYHCKLFCCVPGDGHAGLLPVSALGPGGRCECRCLADEDEGWASLSLIGAVFTVGCTYVGFALLAMGTLWNAELGAKLAQVRTLWRQLRGHGEQPQVGGAPRHRVEPEPEPDLHHPHTSSDEEDPVRDTASGSGFCREPFPSFFTSNSRPQGC